VEEDLDEERFVMSAAEIATKSLLSCLDLKFSYETSNLNSMKAHYSDHFDSDSFFLKNSHSSMDSSPEQQF